MMDDHFEQCFSAFLEGREYDEAEGALFDMVRIAFTAGWKAALGELPQSRDVVRLLYKKPEE